jgi:mRNA-degrading endonuclease YafQ of YafQ-DinJ toxin-antitoxin module
MAYDLIFTAQYEKLEKRFLKQHPEMMGRYHKTLLLLEQNPLHPSLRLHALKGRLKGLHSALINMQYRITLELEIRDKEIVLINVGAHGMVY